MTTQRRMTWTEWAKVDAPPLLETIDTDQGPVYVLSDSTRRWTVTTDATGVLVETHD